MRELSWRPEQAVELSVLGDDAPAVPARILELSGKRMRLAAGSPLKSGAAVRLEWDGQLVLGEVLQSGTSGVWLEIHHMLFDIDGMAWRKQGWQT
jgi:hypothetical protein